MSYLPRKNKLSIISFAIYSGILTVIEIIAVWISVQILQISRAIASGEEIPSIQNHYVDKLLQDLQISQKLFVLGLVAFVFFLFRSLFQILLNKKLLQNLGESAAQLSAIGIGNIVKQNIFAGNHNRLGELEYSLTTGIDKAILTIVGSFSILISDILLILVILVYLFFYDITTAGILFLFGVTSFLVVNRFATRKLKSIGRTKAKLDITLSGEFRDTLSIAGEARNTKFFSDIVLNVKNVRVRQGYLYSLQTIFPYISKYVLELGFLFFAGLLTSYKLATGSISDAASAVGLLFLGGSRLTPALLRAQQSSQAIIGALGPAEQALTTIKFSEDLAQKIETRQFKSPPKIQVRNLDFNWSKDNPIFSNLNIDFPAQQLTCIIGKTGIGKTTLLRLLMGDLKPNSGHIVFSFENESTLDSSSLVYVPQEPHLMSGDLARNLFLSENDFQNRINEIKNLLIKLDLNRLLNIVDVNLNHSKSEKNILNQLSKGEKQRLGLARALLQKANFFILDEPTSALDVRTAKVTIQTILELKERATIITVSHDENLFSKSDSIINLNELNKF